MALHNTFYKKTYTKTDVEECVEWFKQHVDSLPASLTLDSGFVIPNLPFTVQQMIVHLQHRVQGSTVYSGQFSYLLLIRDKLLAEASPNEQPS